MGVMVTLKGEGGKFAWDCGVRELAGGLGHAGLIGC